MQLEIARCRETWGNFFVQKLFFTHDNNCDHVRKHFLHEIYLHLTLYSALFTIIPYYYTITRTYSVITLGYQGKRKSGKHYRLVGKPLSRLGNRNLIEFAIAESKRCTRLKNRPRQKRKQKQKINNKLKIKKGNKL